MNLPPASVTADANNKNGSSVENQFSLKLNGADSNTIRDDDSSRYIGVTYRTRRKKYQARMYRGSHEYNLGLFDLAADAALAYDAAHRIAGGRGSSTSSTPPLKASEGGGTRVSRGGSSSSMIADAEEIKYALDWIDCVDDMERPPGLPEDDPMHLNFLHPSDFRQAREKEKLARLKNNNSDDEVVFPSESDLKLRMKQEILNIAKAYVSQHQQAKTVGPPDEGSDITCSNDDEEEELNQPGDGNSNEVARKESNRPAKKRKLHHKSLSAGHEDCHEEAQTLLSLNKRTTKESKQKARAQKLLEFMTGGEAAVDSKNGQVSKPTQSDGAKENPGSDDRKESPSSAEAIQQQLQQSLTRQQALTIDSFHGSFNQRALMDSLLSQYSLEQLLRFARERPDLVNEEIIQEFVRAQRTDMSQQLGQNDNQRDLLYTQLQAAMMTGGHFNPTQLPMGMQEMAAVAESKQSRGNNASGENAKQINQGGADDGPSGSQIGQSKFMSSVDESPYMKVLEEYKKQGVGNQDQATLQKKIANEAKRAALAQKLSIHLSSNEADAPTSTAERSKIDEKKKSSGEPPSVSDSTERATAAPPDKKGGDKEIKDKKTSPPPSSKKNGVGGSDSSRVADSRNIGADASSKVKPKGQPHAIPPQTPQSVAGSVPAAGLQQGLASLQAMDPFQQAILQHAMVNANTPQQHQLSQSYGGGTASEMPGNAFRLQQLMSEEYRLQQLRQTLQTQALLPYLNMGGFGVSLPNNMLNQLAANNAFAGAGGLANSLMQQQSMNNNNQELLLQQALALQSNQNALMGGALQLPVANNEQMRMAAQRQGIDAGTLAQLLMIRGETSQPPSSSSKKD